MGEQKANGIVEVLMNRILEVVFWFATRRNVKKWVRILVYSMTLLPLFLLAGYLSYTQFQQGDKLAMFLYLIAANCFLWAYANAYRIVFSNIGSS